MRWILIPMARLAELFRREGAGRQSFHVAAKTAT